MPESDDQLPPALQQWVALRDEHIRMLQQQTEQYRLAIDKTKGINDRLEATEQEVQRWRSDYERLRIQKGGFGFKMLILTGFTALLFGLGAGWWFFRPKESNSTLFQRFSQAYGFQLEYQMAQKQYEAAERGLAVYRHDPVFAPILPELELINNLVRAVRSQGDTTATVEGFSMVKKDTFAAAPNAPVRILTITEESGAKIHEEAIPESPVIARLKKKEQAGQWAQTAEPVQLRVPRGKARDYWYEVETKTGQKGWVFGYFTNASLRQFTPDSIPAAVGKDTLRQH